MLHEESGWILPPRLYEEPHLINSQRSPKRLKAWIAIIYTRNYEEHHFRKVKSEDSCAFMNSQGMFIHFREFWNSRYVPTVLTQTYLPSNRTWHVRTKLSFRLAPCPASGVGLAKTQKNIPPPVITKTKTNNHADFCKKKLKRLVKACHRLIFNLFLEVFGWISAMIQQVSLVQKKLRRINAAAVLCFQNSVWSAVQATSRLSRTSCSYIFLSYRAPVPEFLLILNRSKS